MRGRVATIVGDCRFLDVDDHDFVLAWFSKNRLACIVPMQLVVVTYDQKLRLSGRR
jgi:hypothetical protein